jgi:tetratricopeptide (TPR) repeat protein
VSSNLVSLDAYRDRRSQEQLAAEQAASKAELREQQHVDMIDLINVGQRLHERGQYKAAEYFYRAVLAADPDDVIARFNLGVVLDDAGLFKQAAVAYRGVIARRPDFADAHFNLAKMLGILEGKDSTGAVRHLAAYAKLTKKGTER